MDREELQRRFPDLEVGKKPPGLFQFNGCGLALYFSRDADPATGTYVKTLYATLVWIPVFPVGAYRVSDAPKGGWYILGREPPSEGMRIARKAAAAAFVLVVAAAGWNLYTGTDSYKDGVELTGARAAAKAGRIDAAANRFRSLAGSGRSVAGPARDGLKGLVEAITPATDPATARAVLLAAHAPGGGAGPVLPDLWKRAAAYASDPARLPIEKQVETLKSFAPLAPGPDAVAAERRRLVERGAAAAPPDPWSLSEIAAELEAHGDAAGAEALLAPHAARLGVFEGARILGQVRAAQGRFEEAFPLLDRYVTARLGRLHAEAEAFTKAATRAEEAALAQLRSGGETEEWYARHKRSDEKEQARMVAEAIGARVEKDDAFRSQRERYREAARVVPVAMDLGIVRMQRGRAAQDPAASRRELEEAERVFAEIGGVAAGDPEYEFASARVAFWLGKRDAFDAHLAAAVAAAGDGFATRAKVADLVASLGEAEEACRRWEAAYAVAKTAEERTSAAMAVAANMRGEPEATLAWIRKADATNPNVAAAAAECEGRVALAHGDLDAAQKALAASLAAYDRLPRNSVTLNNAALAASQLSSLTGRVDTLLDAGRRLRDALAEMPTNVVVLMNTAQTLEAIGWVRGMEGELDLRLGVDGLRDIRYDDAAGRDGIRASAMASEEMREALRLLDRGLGLVPGNADLVDSCAGLAYELGDFGRLRDLVALVARHPPDTEPARANYLASRGIAADAKRAKGFLSTLQAHLDGLGPDASARDRAVVEAAYVGAACQASLLGVAIDVAALDARARRLHREFPSSGTRTAERFTAGVLVHRALIASDPRYAREAARTVANVGPEPLLLEAFYRDPPLRDAVRASKDFARLVDLVEESGRKFPGELGAISRGLLWAAGRGPLEAPGLSADAEPDWALHGRVFMATSPYAARTAIDRAWTLRIEKKGDRAEEALRECARLGGTIPYLE